MYFLNAGFPKILNKITIISFRYGFIDLTESSREFRPILPKEEPKKLVRYREGQVVSTKGERFSEVAVCPHTGEEVKIRSYLSRSQRAAMAEGNRP